MDSKTPVTVKDPDQLNWLKRNLPDIMQPTIDVRHQHAVYYEFDQVLKTCKLSLVYEGEGSYVQNYDELHDRNTWFYRSYNLAEYLRKCDIKRLIYYGVNTGAGTYDYLSPENDAANPDQSWSKGDKRAAPHVQWLFDCLLFGRVRHTDEYDETGQQVRWKFNSSREPTVVLCTNNHMMRLAVDANADANAPEPEWSQISRHQLEFKSNEYKVWSPRPDSDEASELALTPGSEEDAEEFARSRVKSNACLYVRAMMAFTVLNSLKWFTLTPQSDKRPKWTPFNPRGYLFRATAVMTCLLACLAYAISFSAELTALALNGVWLLSLFDWFIAISVLLDIAWYLLYCLGSRQLPHSATVKVPILPWPIAWVVAAVACFMYWKVLVFPTFILALVLGVVIGGVLQTLVTAGCILSILFCLLCNG